MSQATISTSQSFNPMQTMELSSMSLKSSKTLVFIDANVEDSEYLAQGVKPGIEVHILDAHRDGIEQITAHLFTRPHLEAIHIVSHGSPGCLYLGNTQLNLDTLKRYANLLQTWSASEILLYGCNVAAGDAGAEFLAKIGALTKANIAASANLTGNAALGGDWELEVRTSEINKALGFSSEALEAYSGVLGPGEGLVAHYYNNKTRSGSPTVVRMDDSYNYRDWGTNNPTNGGSGLISGILVPNGREQ